MKKLLAAFAIAGTVDLIFNQGAGVLGCWTAIREFAATIRGGI